MRFFRLTLLVVAFSLCACNDNHVAADEKRIADLEAKVKSLEQAQQAKASADAESAARFKQCASDADDAFTNAIHLNGTRNRDGSYAVPTSSLEQMQRQKRDRLEECRLLYK